MLKLLKEVLTTSVLGYFSQDRPTEAHMDVSSCGIGAILVQKWKGGEHVVS